MQGLGRGPKAYTLKKFLELAKELRAKARALSTSGERTAGLLE